MKIFVALSVFAVLLFLLVPVSVSLGGATILAIQLFDPLPAALIAQKFYANLDKFPLMAVAFFMLAATVMDTGGIVRRLVALADALVGSIRGGLGVATILACMFFAAISGSSAATVAGVGGIMFPALKTAGYSDRYAVGAITTAGALGILIPPSIPLILYGLVTETSIVKLFLAGVIPGIVYGGLLITTAYVLARRENYQVQKSILTLRARATVGVRALPALLVPIALFIGIYGLPAIESIGFAGDAIFTPTEAAIFCVLIAGVVGAVAYDGMGVRRIVQIVEVTTPRVGMLFFLITNAVLFGFFLQQQGIPNWIAQTVLSLGLSQASFLMLVNVIFVIAGLFLDGVPLILMFVPVLIPAVMALGIDPIHFAIIVVVNIELGTLTPPVGVNLYVASAMTGMPIQKVFVACLPWIAVNVVMLLLVTYVPWLSTWLPSLM